MLKRMYKYWGLTCCLILSVQLTFAHTFISGKLSDTTTKESSAQGKSGDGEISTELTTPDKNAFYDNKATYTFEVINTSDTEQIGKVSYQVTTETGEKLNADSVKVRIAKKSSEKYNFEIPESTAGFYKVNFMVNVTDYDDTTRRVFGIKPEEIKSQDNKPADFDAFWKAAKDELAKVTPEYTLTEMPDMSTENRGVYLIEMRSLDSMTVRGWLSLPKTKNKNQKFPVLLDLPGYQVDLQPIVGLDNDIAIITLNVRGQGNSRGPINTRKEEFISYHIEDKNKYVMRGIIMDCLRCVDFICSQPNLRHDAIFVKGGSMGGYLALATASLDKRVKLCSAQIPILCDIRNLTREVGWPMTSIEKYVKTQPGLTMKKIMDNLDYFDGKYFAGNVTCKTMMGIGLLDPFAPPNNEFATYNSIKGKKRILVYKDLGHEVTNVYLEIESSWLRDEFALF
jgi:cephalosporin-C deacetylase